MGDPVASPWSTVCIPARIVVGVTGHRSLDDEPVLASLVHQALDRIKDMVPSSSAMPLAFTVASPLAEGADRLVAREVLKLPNSELEAVLPLARDDYLRDFGTAESRAEFEELLRRAHHIRRMPASASRIEAYDRVGRFIVDHCDVLIAVWNGRPASGQGGTGEIVQYARDAGRPLMWIHAEAGAQLTVERGQGIEPKAFLDLAAYCAERVASDQVRTRSAHQYAALTSQAHAVGYPSEHLRPISERILPHQVRADLLAGRYQRRYVWAGTLVYVFALVAVMVAAAQALFLPGALWVLWFEVGLMVAALATVFLGNRLRWHTKWIDYRFLAERFRSALFMAAAGVEISTLVPPRHLSLAYTSKAWMVRAFSAVWERTPSVDTSAAQGFKALNRFLLRAWIDDQMAYHQDAAARYDRWHRNLWVGGAGLFGLTLAAAAIHALDLAPALHDVLSFGNVVLPVGGGALAAIRTQREYHRSATRSHEMIQHLRDLRDRLSEAPSREVFIHVVAEIEEAMLRENQDWRIVFRFHPLEPPA